MLTIGCPMEFQDYPMDKQVCHLQMQSCKLNLTPEINISNHVIKPCIIFYDNLNLIVMTVSHDINHNSYHWLRPPQIQKNINLDNHEVDIKEYNFTYELDG